MTLGGFIELSLCDYPGMSSSVLFTVGCNFRCPWCHNKSLVYGTGAHQDLDKILTRLAEIKTKVPGCTVTGGEPTLQPDLPEFLARLKRIGLKVKLDTNGYRPDVLEEILDSGLADFVAMDIKAPWDRYPDAVGIRTDTGRLQESVSLIFNSGIRYQFRTTKLPWFTEADKLLIVRQIPHGAIHVWQNYQEPKD